MELFDEGNAPIQWPLLLAKDVCERRGRGGVWGIDWERRKGWGVARMISAPCLPHYTLKSINIQLNNPHHLR